MVEICSLSCFIYAIVSTIKKKQYFTIINYVVLGVFLPLFLHELKWSDLITEEESIMFDSIFVVLALLVLMFSFKTRRLYPNRPGTNEKIYFKTNGKLIVWILNILFILLYFLENYLVSGTFVPALNKIDAHLKFFPVISYITTTPFLIVACDYFAFKASKKKIYLFMLLLVLTIPVVTRSARSNVLIAIIQLLSLVLFFEKEFAKENLKKIRAFNRRKKILIILSLISVVSMCLYTTYRMNLYGTYNLVYADVIGYTGPKLFGILPIYYGYFPMSFNNLKLNILYGKVNHNYIGLYSFSCLYFGLLQLDNLIGIDSQGSFANAIITNGAANVPTAFWDFYYDYGFLFIIPLVFAFCVSYLFLKKASKEKHKLTFRTLYFWNATMWFFLSFQNFMFGSTILVAGFLIYFIMKRTFVVC